MKSKKLLFGVYLSLLVGVATLSTDLAISAKTPQNDLIRANIEALSQSESADDNPCMETMGYDCYGRGSLGVKCTNLQSAADRCKGRGCQCCK